MKFKVGDKVRICKQCEDYFNGDLKGKILTISNTLYDTYGDHYDLQFLEIGMVYHNNSNYFLKVKNAKKSKWMSIWKNI